MTQARIPQINLLKDEFKPRKITYSLQRALAVLGMSAVLIAAHGAWNLHQRSQASERAASAKASEQMAIAVFTKKSIEFATNAIDADIDAQLLQLEQQVLAKAEVKNNVQTALSAAAGIFSPYLRALAEHYRPEVWLENIYFRGNEKLLLEGYAVKSGDLVSYIDRLSSDDLFHGRLFDVFSLKKTEYLPPLERQQQEEQQQQAALLKMDKPVPAKGEKPKEEFFAFQMSAGIGREEPEDQPTPQAALGNAPLISNALPGAN